MKLDRNLNDSGEGKYGVLNMRKLRVLVDEKKAAPGVRQQLDDAVQLLIQHGLLSVEGPRDMVGISGTSQAFFVLKAGDTFAPAALFAYAQDVYDTARTIEQSPSRKGEADSLKELATDVDTLAKQWCIVPGRKIPD